jgi:hypothetical protein
MFGQQEVDLRLTERARQWIRDYIAHSALQAPIVGILFGHAEGGVDRLTIGLYDQGQLQEGWLAIAPELRFVVIQDWLLDRLDGSLLDIDERGPFLVSEPH